MIGGIPLNTYPQDLIQLISGILQAEAVHQQFCQAQSRLFLSHELVFHPAVSEVYIKTYAKEGFQPKQVKTIG